MITTHPSFGTRGRLFFYIAISTYSNNLFFYSFSLFYSTEKEKKRKGEERRLRHKTLQCCFEASRVSSQINAETIPPSEEIPYLVRMITYKNRNWATGLPKHAETTESMGDDSAGPRKDGINGVGPGRNVQGGGAVGVTLWKRELGGDRGDAQGPDGIIP